MSCDMQIQIQHTHEQEQKLQQTPEIEKKPLKIKPEFIASIETKNKMIQILNHSKIKLNQYTINTISHYLSFSQKKIFTSFDQNPTSYLKQIAQQKFQHLGGLIDPIQQYINGKCNKIIQQLNKQQLLIEQSPKKPASKIIQQLQLQYETIKKKSPSPIKQFISEKRPNKQEILKEFKDKAYWLKQNPKNEEVKCFIKKMKKQKLIEQSRILKLTQKQKQRLHEIELKKQKQIQSKNKSAKDILKKQLQKSKEQRKKHIQEENIKKQQLKKFLQKFKHSNQKNKQSNRYHKQKQQQLNKLLVQIKQQKRHSSFSQLRERMKEIEKIKQQHDQRRKKQNLQKTYLQKITKSHLSKLYKSKASLQSLIFIDKKSNQRIQSKKNLLKKLSYSQRVKSNFSPQIDMQKRQELISRVQQLKNRQLYPLRKHLNGQQIILNKEQLSPKKDGIKYLQQLRIFTTKYGRKTSKSSLTQEPKHKKIIDYSKIKNKFYNKKITISNWKQIIQNNNINQQQKVLKIQDYLRLAEQTKVKHIQMKRSSSPQKKMKFQTYTDHLDISITQAKLALLKSIK